MLFQTKFLLTSQSFSVTNKCIRYVHLKKHINSIFFPQFSLRNTLKQKNGINMGLLFLNHGLKTDEINKIKSLLNKFQITITKLPIRVLSKSSFKHSGKLFVSLNGKKAYIYGEMLLVHACHDQHNFYGSECLYFLYKQLMHYFILKTSPLFTSSNLSNKLISNFDNPSSFYTALNTFETLPSLNSNVILPWDIISVKSLPSTKDSVNEWVKGDSIDSFIKLISKGSLTFLAQLKTQPQSVDSTFIKPNISIISENINLYTDYNTLSSNDLNRVLSLNTLHSFEPYTLPTSGLNLSFFYFI